VWLSVGLYHELCFSGKWIVHVLSARITLRRFKHYYDIYVTWIIEEHRAWLLCSLEDYNDWY